MSKPKPKTKRSRGSAITDAARPAVPAIEAVEPPPSHEHEFPSLVEVASEKIPVQRTLKFPWSHPAVIVAICTTITAIIGAWNHHASSVQYDATLRQTTANEKNIGHVWHEMNVYGDYIKPDWQHDAGEIPAK